MAELAGLIVTSMVIKVDVGLERTITIAYAVQTWLTHTADDPNLD